MEQRTGKIIKGIGGFYYIKPSESFSFFEDQIIEAKARGRFRHEKITPLVGDSVHFFMEGEKGVITKILPRFNDFVRPPVANVDIALLTFAVSDPEPDLFLLDKLLVTTLLKNTQPIICLTKTDLISVEQMDQIRAVYDKIQIPLLCFCNREGDDLPRLQNLLSEHTAFMAGPSGVGKSSLANRLTESYAMETGAISERSGRGKHTTRHVELLPMASGGYLLDTPGFSSLDLECQIQLEELGNFFPEFLAGACRFNTCTHRSEPGCAVKAAVTAGEVHSLRYEHYLAMYEAIEKKQRR